MIMNNIEQMKLIDLNPRWCIGAEYVDDKGTICRITNNPNHGRIGMGLSFDCPVHRNHRLVVMFVNPIDDMPKDSTTKHLWSRTGDTFLNMTLSPSIDASTNFSGCWHGYVRNGEIV